jgi:tetratricopeptide (TPR) repeat protein
MSGRPLAAFTLALNYALAPADVRDVFAPAGPGLPADAAVRFARNVWGYHALNLIVHVLAALALFGVVRRTLLSPALRERYGPVATGAAGAIALIWVVHPLNTEAVTYVVQRVESLMGLCYLTTLYCAIRATEDSGRRLWWMAAAVIVCACGMATKEVMVTAPIMVAIWDWLFLRPANQSAVDSRRRWRFYTALGATWLVLAALVVQMPRAHAAGFSLGWTWSSYLATQMGVVLHYLRLAIVPAPLVLDYSWPKATSIGEIALPALAILALAAASTWMVAKRRPAGFLGAWFLLILAPSSSVLPIVTEIAAEHRMYLPVAGVIAFMVLGGYRLLVRAPVSTVRAATVIGAAAVMVAAVFATLTRDRNRDYWSDEGLWAKTVEQRPGNARARVSLAIDLLARQRTAGAEGQLREAIRLSPEDARAHLNLGLALYTDGNAAGAIAELERSKGLDPASGETAGALGEAYLAAHRPADAVASFQRALDLLPDGRASRYLMSRVAWLLATSPDDRLRDGPRAVALGEKAVALTNRRDPVALDALGAAYAETERFADATRTLEEAVSVAESEQQSDVLPGLRERLDVYRSGRKVRSSGGI